MRRKVSQQDIGNGFAPAQGEKHFSFGTQGIDEAWMHSKLTELLKQRAEKHRRYSAGHPAENGDISGVAKNSYYIENGQIVPR